MEQTMDRRVPPMRHVAKLANTDQRCIVAYMQIPNREDHSLIVPVDGLTPRLEQAIMQVLKTPEGQQAESFVDVLHRHRMPDSGDTILATLHKTGKLVPVPVANVLMLPYPNRPVKLTAILEGLGRAVKTHDFSQERFNPHAYNQTAAVNENARGIARGLMMEAEMLENDAKRKREQAYAQDPSLRPVNEVMAAQTADDPFGYDMSAASAFTHVESFPIETPVTGGMQTEQPGIDADGFSARLDRIEQMFERLLQAKQTPESTDTAEEAE